MVCAGLQLIGFILGVLSWVGMIATCASPEWRRNSRGNTIFDMSVRYEGLWTKCSLFINGQTKCTPYDSFFVGVPGVLQVCRALMIASLVLGLFAVLITIYGIRCTSVANRHQQAKARAAIIGGILFLIAGLHVGMAVSIYAWCTSSQCFDHLQVTGLLTNYEMGPAVIGGWIVMTSAFWSAFLTIVNYNSLSKPTKTMDLSQIRADSLTGQFSDIASEGAKGVYKSKSPVDSGYTSTGLDSNWGLYSSVSYPSSIASSIQRPTCNTKLIKPETFPYQRSPQTSYDATSTMPTSFHSLPKFGRSFYNSKSFCDGNMRRPSCKVPERHKRDCYSSTSQTSATSSNREIPLKRNQPTGHRPRSRSPNPSHVVTPRLNNHRRTPLTRNYKTRGKRRRGSVANNQPQFGTLRRNMINCRTISREPMAHFDAPHLRPRSPFYPAPQFSSLRHISLNQMPSQGYQLEPRHRSSDFADFRSEMSRNAFEVPNRRSLIATSRF